MTFRLPNELAVAVREMPNQTRFVEEALADALGRGCPVCGGTGRVPSRPMTVTNVRDLGLRRLSREEAKELQQVYRIGRQLAATRLALTRRGKRISYTLTRNGSRLIQGPIEAHQ